MSEGEGAATISESGDSLALVPAAPPADPAEARLSQFLTRRAHIVREVSDTVHRFVDSTALKERSIMFDASDHSQLASHSSEGAMRYEPQTIWIDHEDVLSMAAYRLETRNAKDKVASTGMPRHWRDSALEMTPVSLHAWMLHRVDYRPGQDRVSVVLVMEADALHILFRNVAALATHLLDVLSARLLQQDTACDSFSAALHKMMTPAPDADPRAQDAQGDSDPQDMAHMIPCRPGSLLDRLGSRVAGSARSAARIPLYHDCTDPSDGLFAGVGTEFTVLNVPLFRAETLHDKLWVILHQLLT